MRMATTRDSIAAIVRHEVARCLGLSDDERNKHLCPNCLKQFTPTHAGHVFCTRSCYGRFHRVPGTVRAALAARQRTTKRRRAA